MTTPISPLVANILTANAAFTADVTTRVIEDLRERASESEARVDVIRDAVEHLLSGPYTPSPAAIRNALYPSAEVVAAYRVDWEVSA
jgi:hypothetical protein